MTPHPTLIIRSAILDLVWHSAPCDRYRRKQDENGCICGNKKAVSDLLDKYHGTPSSLSFPGGYVDITPGERKTVLEIHGIADSTSVPGQAGDGPVRVEIRAPE